MFEDWPVILMIFKFTDHKASCVKIPARMAGIPNNVCNKPVTSPHNKPAIKPRSNPSQKLPPEKMITAHTAPPVTNDPSTVKSGISSIL